MRGGVGRVGSGPQWRIGVAEVDVREGYLSGLVNADGVAPGIPWPHSIGNK